MFKIRTIRNLPLDKDGAPDLSGIPIHWATGFELLSMAFYKTDPVRFREEHDRISLFFSATLSMPERMAHLTRAYAGYLDFIADQDTEIVNVDDLLEGVMEDFSLLRRSLSSEQTS